MDYRFVSERPVLRTAYPDRFEYVPTTEATADHHYRPYAAKNNAIYAGSNECVLLVVPSGISPLLASQ